MPRYRFLLCLVLLPGSGAALAQGSTTAGTATAGQARCAQLAELWDRYGASKGEGGGSMDMPHKSAVADCAAGRTDSGIRTLEDLLRRNGYTVPPP